MCVYMHLYICICIDREKERRVGERNKIPAPKAVWEAWVEGKLRHWWQEMYPCEGWCTLYEQFF